MSDLRVKRVSLNGVRLAASACARVMNFSIDHSVEDVVAPAGARAAGRRWARNG